MVADVPAAKLVLANMGPIAGRWIPKGDIVHEAGGSLARLLEQIGEKETVLPSVELGLNDDEGTRSEDGQPVLADEQPLLDNGPTGPTD